MCGLFKVPSNITCLSRHKKIIITIYYILRYIHYTYDKYYNQLLCKKKRKQKKHLTTLRIWEDLNFCKIIKKLFLKITRWSLCNVYWPSSLCLLSFQRKNCSHSFQLHQHEKVTKVQVNFNKILINLLSRCKFWPTELNRIGWSSCLVPLLYNEDKIDLPVGLSWGSDKLIYVKTGVWWTLWEFNQRNRKYGDRKHKGTCLAVLKLFHYFYCIFTNFI